MVAEFTGPLDGVDALTDPFGDRLRLPFTFDVSRMEADLGRFDASAWTAHPVHTNYEGSWSVIPLRAPRDATHPLRMIYADPGGKDFVDTPFLVRCSYFRDVLSNFACPPRSRLTMSL